MNVLMIRLTIYILFISTIFMQNFNNVIEYSASDSNVNLTIAFNQKEYLNDEVKGLQFDLEYDANGLMLNELTSLIDGAIFEYLPVNERAVRCVIFNLDGKSFSMEDLSKLIIASFTSKRNFYASARVNIKNIIIAGDFGEDISDNYFVNSFQINFNKLQPANTHIHMIAQEVFSDSIDVSFQIHQPGNALLTVYDIFENKRKTIFNGYVKPGVYSSKLSPYDDFEEEFEPGRFKIKLLMDFGLKDSIYVVYEKNKN